MKCNGIYMDDRECYQYLGCGKPGCPVNAGSLRPAIQDVVDFHTAMGQPVMKTLHTPGDDRVRLRANLIIEECKETVDAMFEKCAGLPYEWDNVEYRDVNVDHVELADGLADLIYVVIGAANEFGIPLEKVWDVVHASNMAKIGPNGEVKRREDGKVIKPDGWTPPDVKGVLGVK
jgi:predicted HAD superfamily Cof-like phosphohydrolase